jgi:hypothetical protein
VVRKCQALLLRKIGKFGVCVLFENGVREEESK